MVWEKSFLGNISFPGFVVKGSIRRTGLYPLRDDEGKTGKIIVFVFF